MTVVRSPRRRGFVQVENTTARDRRLTFRASGLLVHLLSLPDWEETTVDDIVAEAVEGRDAIRGAMRELEAHGYILRTRHRDEAGRWVHKRFVHEVPTLFTPQTDSQSTVPPAETDETAGQPADWKPDVGRSGDRKEEDLEDVKTRKTPVATPPAPATTDGTTLFGPPSAKPPRSPESIAAVKVTRAIYEARDPRPTTAFVGVVAIVKRKLKVGWSEAELVAAGTTAMALTDASLEVALQTARRPARRPGGSSTSDGQAYDERVRSFVNGNPSPAPGPRPFDVREATP